jgi:hypothetical protein
MVTEKYILVPADGLAGNQVISSMVRLGPAEDPFDVGVEAEILALPNGVMITAKIISAQNLCAIVETDFTFYLLQGSPPDIAVTGF